VPIGVGEGNIMHVLSEDEGPQFALCCWVWISSGSQEDRQGGVRLQNANLSKG